MLTAELLEAEIAELNWSVVASEVSGKFRQFVVEITEIEDLWSE